MGEPDLLGFDDCGPDFAEEDSDSLEHVRHRAYWAINTGRGQDWEQPDRWLAFESFVQGVAAAIVQAHAQSVGTDLTEVDPQIEKASYRVEAGELTTWTAELTTARGTTFAEGTLQPLPQDVDASEDDGGPAFQLPVAPGGKTIRQGAIDGADAAWFPHWLLGPNSGRIVYSFGLVLDASIEWLMQGIQQRFPLVADEGALPYLGRDLGILRGVRESTEAYRKRLTRWAPTHRRAGTPFSIAEQVQAYFAPQSPTVYVVQHDPTGLTRATWSVRYYDGAETTIVNIPTNWDYDSEDASRPESLDARDPRVWLIIEQPASGVGGLQGLFAERTSSQAVASDPDGMNGLVRPGGGRAPSDQYRDLLGLVERWRAMGTWVAGVLVVLGTIDPAGGGATHPDGRWFDMLNDTRDGNRIPSDVRILYLNRYPGERLADGATPYEV